MTIVRNSFIQMSKLTNLKGRINYISSPARQENLYAVYETTDRKFWRELAKYNQEEFRKSGTSGTCIEARELIIALPESFVDYQPELLLIEEAFSVANCSSAVYGAVAYKQGLCDGIKIMPEVRQIIQSENLSGKGRQNYGDAV